MQGRLAFPVVALAAVLVGCADAPVAPNAAVPDVARQGNARPGTGLVLESVTGLTVPLLGIPLGDVVIDEAVITDLHLIEDVAGAIIGIEAEGILQLTGGVLGTDVVTENFRTDVGITSSGPGKCDLVTIDLAPINVDVLQQVAEVNVPAAEVNARGSGAVGSLLCTLGALLGGLGSGVEGVVNGINNLI